MKILTVAMNKGGTGKTTLSELVATGMAKRGRATILMDLDPQCNASSRYVSMETDPTDPEVIRPPLHPDYTEEDPSEDPDWDGRGSSADIFLHGTTAIYPTDVENLSIIPGHSSNLMLVERVTQADVKTKVHNHLRDWFQDAWTMQEQPDLVVIDTGPSKGPLTTSAMNAASHTLIPSEMEEHSIEGLYGMIAYWRNCNMRRPPEDPIELVGIIANKFDSRVPLHLDYYERLQEQVNLQPFLLPMVIHRWQDYADAASPGGRRVMDLPPSNKCRGETDKLLDLLEARLWTK